MSRLLNRIPRRMAFTLALVAVMVALLSLFRVVFWFLFAAGAPEAPASAHLWAFYLGLKFDLRLSLLVAAPLLLLSFVPYLDPCRSVRVRMVWSCYLVVVWVLISVTYFVDFGHYEKLHARVDSSVFEHVEGPTEEVLEAMWTSFPVGWGLLGVALTTGVFLLAVRKAALAQLRAPAEPGGKGFLATVVAAGVLCYAGGIYGKLSWYPLRWSDAYFRPDPFTSALGLNPVLFLFDTWRTRRAAYSEAETRRYYPVVARHLGVDRPDPKRLDYLRSVPPARRFAVRPNIVIVFMESLAAFKTGAFGNPVDPTPHLDRIARRSLLFTNFHCPAGPTARAIFSVITGIADVSGASSSSKNPRKVDQHTIAAEFEGYDKLYFSGGSVSWGNIRALLTYNLPGLEIFEEGSYESPRLDVWGLSDYHLFKEAHRVLSRRRARPFLAFIQTSGNHRPFNIPDDAGDFRRVSVDEERLRAAGFDEGLREYNALRFMDYSLGNFLELAAREDYYKRTIFLIFGDHGTHGLGTNPWEALLLTHSHVPFLIHSPHLIPRPEVRNDVVSALDVMPIAAGLAGIPYRNRTMGKDVVSLRPIEHFAFVRLGAPYGLVGNQFYLRIDPGSPPRLYRYRSPEPTKEVSKEHPEVHRRMADLCRGLFHTARWMLEHNQRR